MMADVDAHSGVDAVLVVHCFMAVQSLVSAKCLLNLHTLCISHLHVSAIYVTLDETVRTNTSTQRRPKPLKFTRERQNYGYTPDHHRANLTSEFKERAFYI